MTKWVFAALLAINAGYLAWGVLFGSSDTPAREAPPATEPGVAPLVLLRERPAAAEARTAAPTPPAARPPAAAPRSIAPSAGPWRAPRRCRWPAGWARWSPAG